MKRTLAIAALLSAVLTLGASHANAQFANPGDLLLCFTTTGNPGSTINLEVDLGAYNSPAASTNLNADLVATYGSSWFTRTDLFWGVVGADQGTTSAPFDTVWLGSLPTTSLTQKALSTQDALASNLLNNGYGQLNGGQGTEATQVTNTAAGSYNDLFSSNISTNWSGTQQSANVGTLPDSESLWQLVPNTSSNGSATKLGSFTLNNSGIVSFAAVPEPSTWASILVGAGSLLAFRRRRA